MSAELSYVWIILFFTTFLECKAEADFVASCNCTTPPPCLSYDVRKLLYIEETVPDTVINVSLACPIGDSSSSVCVDRACPKRRIVEHTTKASLCFDKNKINNNDGVYLDIFTCKDSNISSTTDISSSPASEIRTPPSEIPWTSTTNPSSPESSNQITPISNPTDQTTLSHKPPSNFSSNSSEIIVGCDDGHCCQVCDNVPIVVVVLLLSLMNGGGFMIWYRIRAEKINPEAKTNSDNGLVNPFGFVFGIVVWYRKPEDKDPEATKTDNNNQTCDKLQKNHDNRKDSHVYHNHAFVENEQDKELNEEKEELENNSTIKSMNAQKTDDDATGLNTTDSSANSKAKQKQKIDGADIAKIAKTPAESNC